MREQEVEYTLICPSEVVAARQRCPVAFVLIGPLEWHRLRLPLGMDGLHPQQGGADAAVLGGAKRHAASLVLAQSVE